MPDLVKWVGGANSHLFSGLKRLKCICCPKLSELPLSSCSGSSAKETNNMWFPNLCSLDIMGCPELSLPLVPHTSTLTHFKVNDTVSTVGNQLFLRDYNGALLFQNLDNLEGIYIKNVRHMSLIDFQPLRSSLRSNEQPSPPYPAGVAQSEHGGASPAPAPAAVERLVDGNGGASVATFTTKRNQCCCRKGILQSDRESSRSNHWAADQRLRRFGRIYGWLTSWQGQKVAAVPKPTRDPLTMAISGALILPGGLFQALNILSVLGVFGVLVTKSGATDFQEQPACVPFSCGHLEDIRYPFRLRGDPVGCGDEAYELDCRDGRAIIHINTGKYFVTDIAYSESRFWVVDANLDNSSCPLPLWNSLPYFNDVSTKLYTSAVRWATFLNCSRVINNGMYMPVACLSGNTSFVYVLTTSSSYYVQTIEPSCGYLAVIPVDDRTKNVPDYASYADVVRFMRNGFPVLFPRVESPSHSPVIKACARDTFQNFKDQMSSRTIQNWTSAIIGSELQFLGCVINYYSSPAQVWVTLVLVFAIEIIKCLIVLCRFILAPLAVLTFLGYKYRKTRISIDAVEKFLKMQQALGPKRYAYTEITAITGHFREKLGQGGYGSVYKGFLPGDGHVAIKMLSNSMCNGEEFISEVSTISRIHHVNVVRLVGFCSEELRRALVYEYMSCGSLDKYIFAPEKSLSWEKLSEIALGIARGIDYLHHGCDMQIMHFDIKPHNILLDSSFTPKIADFGLAKLYPRDESLVPMSAARGTIGYIAPEMISRSFGAISCKADVYSFGMLLLDIAGGRRSREQHTSSSVHPYYPALVYDWLTQQEVNKISEDVDIHWVEKKLCIVGFWCIQMKPTERPSMSEVVEMLESDDPDNLQAIFIYTYTHHLLPLLLAAIITTATAATLNITNLCSFTVWPAAVPVGGGTRLDTGKSWTLDVPTGTAPGRVWARTGCSFDANGNSTCLTGDCGGVLSCTSYGDPPQTLAEFSLDGTNGQDQFDISLVDGFNVPMDFLPVTAPCSKGPRCPANVTAQCPGELKAHGGCNSACRVFRQDKYCCTGNGSNTCEPTTYSMPFVRMCPDAYSYSRNDESSPVFSCPSGTNYQIIFCPPVDLTSSSPAPVEVAADNRQGKVIAGIVASVIGSTSVLVIVVGYMIIKRRTRRHQEIHEEEQEFEEITLQGMPRRFTFQQLQEATDHFRDKLGEGGFGSVFEGKIGDERVAVKRLDRSGQGMKEFLAEVQTIGSIHHINLVRLIGFCTEKSQRLLVYEHMPKGSLDRWIYHQQGCHAPTLDWRTRYRIITQVAKGLSYLHEECMKRIAHLDVKPQNILLDDNFNAKLSDFGLCKLIDRDKSQVITRMRGTPGYLAPEWLTSQITEKADVYSFGIVVMEIISGRKNVDTSCSEHSIHLITLLQEKVKSDQLVDLIDKKNNDMQVHEKEVIETMRLAMWCLQIDCKRRPQMSEVVKVLEGTISIETNIVHEFVAINPVSFGVLVDSALPLASDLSGPRPFQSTNMSRVVVVTALLLSLTINHGTDAATMDSAWEDQDFFRHCPVSRCSRDGPEIRFPHRLKSSNTSSACGASCARLTCSGQNTILNHSFLGPCNVTSIDYKEAVMKIIPLVDTSSPCPLQNLLIFNDELTGSYYDSCYQFSNICSLHQVQPAKIVRCSKEFTSPTNDYDTGNVAGPISCLSDGSHFSYLVDARNKIYSLPLDCKAISKAIIPIPLSIYDKIDGTTFKQRAEMIISFSVTTVRWIDGYYIAGDCTDCENQGRSCAFSLQRNQTFCMRQPHDSHVKVIAVASSVAAFVRLSLVVATALYLSLKIKYNEEVHLKVEMFLRTWHNEIQKEKVGQGGFGTVYKGELQNGVPVAVKMIENPTGDGEEFINEVATIGRIHHANIVRLLGFCSEGTRRALIYEFMPNESLEKYIFLHNPNTQAPLSPNKMLDIALGIARGMEYLHQGCNQRILHFDIKPHNILLDYNFNPKISDFGLAKLCARDQSIVTLTKARGTMGYIAPELYSRNFGDISYKSDVYSFGMLVLEMVSGRRIWDPSTENQNEVYFPEWIYEKVIGEQDFVLSREMTEEEKLTVRQLALVALWCIHWNPRNRPSMTKVVNMITGKLENMQVPPKPFVS
uniref:non-specific serine/threonine protein kinase n=1 Tax=Leersia perrieri TaxID=77586 RepID=A0A0D9UW04_9ORYZ